jgi:cytochrome c-type biogenesis protein CcmH
LLARSLGTLGRWPEARAAQAEVVELLGDAASADDLVALAELMIVGTGGYVSPDAEAALARARGLAPANPLARYYSALGLAQAGQLEQAAGLWEGLRVEGPADAPWMEAVEAQLAALSHEPGPDADEIDAAGAMSADERQAMIEGMVGGLAERLAAEGGPAEDWARLIRALAVLGRGDEAAEARDAAAEAYAGDTAALAVIAAAAADAGLAP